MFLDLHVTGYLLWKDMTCHMDHCYSDTTPVYRLPLALTVALHVECVMICGSHHVLPHPLPSPLKTSRFGAPFQ